MALRQIVVYYLAGLGFPVTSRYHCFGTGTFRAGHIIDIQEFTLNDYLSLKAFYSAATNVRKNKFFFVSIHTPFCLVLRFNSKILSK